MSVEGFEPSCTTPLLADLFDDSGKGEVPSAPREVNEDTRAKNAGKRPMLRCCVGFWAGESQDKAFSHTSSETAQSEEESVLVSSELAVESGRSLSESRLGALEWRP